MPEIFIDGGVKNTNTFIDGGGALSDEPLPLGTRIRFHINDDRSQDITAYVANGELQIYGFHRPLLITPVEANHVAVTTGKWHGRNT